MARAFAQFKTSIWNPDDDFCRLPGAAQHMYFVLSSQTDITAAGTLALTVKRWARHSLDGTPESVTAAIQLLVDARYVVVDNDTEELLIRTFIKADNGYGNEKRRGAIRDAATSVASKVLKAVIADELGKLGLTDMAHAVSPDKASDALSNGLPGREFTGQEGTSQNRRVVVSQVELVDTPTHNTQHATPIPQPGGPSPQAADEKPHPQSRPSENCEGHPTGTTGSCGGCARAGRNASAWDVEERHRRSAATSEAAQERARLVRDAINHCGLCDHDGYRPGPDGTRGPHCDHVDRQPGALARARAAVTQPERTTA